MKIPEKPMDVFDEIRGDIGDAVIGAVIVTLLFVGLSWLIMEFMP